MCGLDYHAVSTDSCPCRAELLLNKAQFLVTEKLAEDQTAYAGHLWFFRQELRYSLLWFLFLCFYLQDSTYWFDKVPFGYVGTGSGVTLPEAVAPTQGGTLQVEVFIVITSEGFESVSCLWGVC